MLAAKQSVKTNLYIIQIFARQFDRATRTRRGPDVRVGMFAFPAVLL